jgi:DNA polymerase-1
MSKNVKAFADQLETARDLVTLRRDVPMDFDLNACRWDKINCDALRPLFQELGFRRLLEQLDQISPPSPEQKKKDDSTSGLTRQREYVPVDNEEKFKAFIEELKQQDIFAFDTETTSLKAMDARLVGISFCWEAGRAWYLPLLGMGDCLPPDVSLDPLRKIFADPRIRKIGQNLKYDLVVLRQHGFQVAGVEFDTMIASFVLDSTRRSHGMDALARELLQLEPIPISDLIGKGKKQIGFDSVDTRRACEYAAEDADITWQLGEIFRNQLDGSPLYPLFTETEMPLVEVLADMEFEGVRLDTDVLAKMSNELADRLKGLTEQIYKEVGHEFNIDSTKALATVLFEELELPVIKKTKTGMSTDAATLESLTWQTTNPVPCLVKEYRELTKLKNTYIDTLPEMICEKTGRIHAGFNQTGTITGRLSSSEPNLQNIPIRTELGRQIRRAFVPRNNDYVLITADYSQIELRILAHLSEDQALLKAFDHDRDIHQFVAGQIFGVPLDQVTKEQRGKAKAVNFGIVYGQTPYGLSRSTGMPVGEAQAFIDMYFMQYPGIRLFIDRVIDEAGQKGYVQTILGRRRAIPDINSRNRNSRQAAQRLAINTVTQGSAADLIKRAMINIHRRIHQEDRPSRMLIQVHDELVFDAPRDGVKDEADFIREEMCQALDLKVPVKVDLAWGENWLESK